MDIHILKRILHLKNKRRLYMSGNLTCPHCGCILTKLSIGCGYECRACHASLELKDLIVVIKESPNENRRFITIIKSDGKREIAEVIIDFEFNDNNKEFLIYTKGESDTDGYCTLYISGVDRSQNGTPLLVGVNDIDYDRVEIVLNDLAFSDDHIEIV